MASRSRRVYGSELHLLRYLGRHRHTFDDAVAAAVGGDEVTWLDFPFDSSRDWRDRELKGLEFLPESDHARRDWSKLWPQRGNPPNWDAVGQVIVAGQCEWLLVEAKANLQELASSCGAKEDTKSWRQIRDALSATKARLGASTDRDWLNGYYQYCYRLVVLDLLNQHHQPARLLHIYFCGDLGDARRTCPKDAAGWQDALAKQAMHVGLPSGHPLSNRIHELFLVV